MQRTDWEGRSPVVLCVGAGAGVEHGQGATSAVFIRTPHLTFGHRVTPWAWISNVRLDLLPSKPQGFVCLQPQAHCPVCKSHTDVHDVEKRMRQARYQPSHPEPVPLSTLSVPLHTCRSAADSMQFPLGAPKNGPVNLKVPNGRSLQFKEPEGGDIPQLKDTRQPTELWRASPAQTDCKLETHLL